MPTSSGLLPGLMTLTGRRSPGRAGPSGNISLVVLSPKIRHSSEDRSAPASWRIDWPACVLLNNQATDRLTDDLLKPAWPFGLGSCPKVNHDADDADRVPEGAQRIWSRAHGATGLDPERTSSNISDFYCAERQPPWLSRRARRQGVRKANTFQLGAKDPAGIQEYK
jgi:hypothetical protein